MASSQRQPDVFNARLVWEPWRLLLHPSGRQLGMGRTLQFQSIFFSSITHFILLATQVLRQVRVGSNLLLIWEMKERNGPLRKIHWLVIPPKLHTRLRKGRARTQACSSGLRLAAPFTSILEMTTFRFSKISFSYSFKET